MNTARKFRSADRLSVDEYLAFIARRPSAERWQLIDGVAIMLTPPTLRHQTVARNLMVDLNVHFRIKNLPFSALQEVGLIVPDVAQFRPACDVAVVDTSIDLDSSFADRFFLVAEVLSPSSTEDDVELKRTRYLQHPDNLYCLIISQSEFKVEVWTRASGWQCQTLTDLDDVVALPTWDFTANLADIYLNTRVGKRKRA